MAAVIPTQRSVAEGFGAYRFRDRAARTDFGQLRVVDLCLTETWSLVRKEHIVIQEEQV